MLLYVPSYLISIAFYTVHILPQLNNTFSTCSFQSTFARNERKTRYKIQRVKKKKLACKQSLMLRYKFCTIKSIRDMYGSGINRKISSFLYN